MAGIKKVENRSWPTRHRGALLIHAGAARDPIPWVFADGTKPPDLSELVYGAILGSVEVVDCVPLADAPDTPFTNGPWCWVLANPRPFTDPIPHVGQVGLWTARVEASCEHCHKSQPVELGGERQQCIRCKKWFSVEW
jgi:hypothetical protein